MQKNYKLDFQRWVEENGTDTDKKILEQHYNGYGNHLTGIYEQNGVYLFEGHRGPYYDCLPKGVKKLIIKFLKAKGVENIKLFSMK